MLVLNIMVACSIKTGHIFPIYLHFEGGKAVATTLGCCIGMAKIYVIGYNVVSRLGIGRQNFSCCRDFLVNFRFVVEFFSGMYPHFTLSVGVGLVIGYVTLQATGFVSLQSFTMTGSYGGSTRGDYVSARTRVTSS